MFTQSLYTSTANQLSTQCYSCLVFIIKMCSVTPLLVCHCAPSTVHWSFLQHQNRFNKALIGLMAKFSFWFLNCYIGQLSQPVSVRLPSSSCLEPWPHPGKGTLPRPDREEARRPQRKRCGWTGCLHVTAERLSTSSFVQYVPCGARRLVS